MPRSTFTRRMFIQGLGSLGTTARVFLPVWNSSADRLDRYGGLKDVRFEQSGFFRVDKADRWWFVTPDGSAFLSYGFNHASKEYLLQPYNIDHWKAAFGVQDASDPAFGKAFIKKVMADLDTFGMNSIGTHARKEEFGMMAVPYVQGLYFVRTPYWTQPTEDKFADVFSADFETRCKNVCKRAVTPRRDDPFLLGYTFTDCPILTDRDANAHGQVSWGGAQSNLPTWPRVLRNLGPESPGKKAFVNLVAGQYPGIADFNRAYKTSFGSFDALLAAHQWSSVLRSDAVDDAIDNHTFLIKIMDRYYSVACATVCRSDPNHLIFGDILNAQTAPPDEIVSLVASHTDLTAYQFYDDYDAHSQILDRWSKLTGKPLYHADSCFSVAYEEMPSPIGAVCPDQETRARRFFDTASRSLSRPDVIGYNWCGWMDMWAAWRNERQHSGLQDPFGRYHDPMPETMARFGAQLYQHGQRGGL